MYGHLSQRSRARLLPILLLSSLFLVACGTAGSRSGEAHRPIQRHAVPDRGYDVQHYALDLELEPELRRIQGRCGISLRASRAGLASVELDLVGLEVLRVRDEAGLDLDYLHQGDSLTVDLPVPLSEGELFELTVVYGGTPTTGLWFSGRRGDGSGPTQVFTQGQANHSRGWFPCFDHPSDRATSEVRVTMPVEWTSICPGERLSSEIVGDRRVEHWRMGASHPSYLTSLVAGELVVVDDEWDGVPLVYASEMQHVKWLEASFNETDDILAFLSDYTGVRYPYPKYSQAVVANFPWGGMENISATTLTPLTLDDERGQRDDQSHGLVAHEAAHQWFGNFMTCDDWAHVWLNEGFATYMTELYFEASRGQDEFRARMRELQRAYLEEDRGSKRRPTVWNVYREPEDLFDTRSYDGAASRLHLLRFLLGDEAFRAGVRTYVAENAGQNVVTEDLQRAMEKVSGVELDDFFEQWIYGRGYPEFSIDWRWEPSRILLTVRQEQGSTDGTPRVFRLPVDVEVRDSSGTTQHRIELTQRSQVFELAARERPYYVRFDKHGWVPKTMRWKRSASEWIAILTADDDVNGRRDAVTALGRLAAEAREQKPEAHETYVAGICNRLLRDESAWVRADAAEALGVAGGLEARERLIQASADDASARVRVAALRALRAWGENRQLAAVARERFDERYSWWTMGAAAGLVCSADPDSAYAWISDKLFIDSPHDQLCGLLLEHLGHLDDPAVPDQLLRWAHDESLHPSARAVAVRQLGRQDRGRAGRASDLEPFLQEESFHLRLAAVEALAEVGDFSARSALRGYYPSSRTPGERRAIEAALSGRGS